MFLSEWGYAQGPSDIVRLFGDQAKAQHFSFFSKPNESAILIEWKWTLLHNQHVTQSQANVLCVTHSPLYTTELVLYMSLM
jgi:hypothetical protein